MSFCSRDCPCLEGTVEQSKNLMHAVMGGCLPDGFEIRNGIHHGDFWECHNRPGVICEGARKEAEKHNIPIPHKPTVGQTFGRFHNGN